MKSDIQKALDKLMESMELMAKDAGDWKVSDIAAVKGLTKEIVNLKQQLATAKKENEKYRSHLLELESAVEKTSFIELENVHLKQQLADLKANHNKIKAETLTDLIEDYLNGPMHQELTISYIYSLIDKLEAGNG